MNNEKVGVSHVSGAVWRRSSHTREGNCVEIANVGRYVAFRDSRDPEGPRLHVHTAALGRLIEVIKAGGLDG
ncbi:DUF397 domain-containing protein [Spirillospora sp. CA-294931]|uniref:DUF397 domain-containing protein n=1 Tax=Spirillospora sp. CA-294931 TaxID=3240042 RepID=UPI003D93F167